MLNYYCPKAVRQRRSLQRYTMPQKKKLPQQRLSVPKDVPKEDLGAIAPIKVQA